MFASVVANVAAEHPPGAKCAGERDQVMVAFVVANVAAECPPSAKCADETRQDALHASYLIFFAGLALAVIFRIVFEGNLGKIGLDLYVGLSVVYLIFCLVRLVARVTVAVLRSLLCCCCCGSFIFARLVARVTNVVLRSLLCCCCWRGHAQREKGNDHSRESRHSHASMASVEASSKKFVSRPRASTPPPSVKTSNEFDRATRWQALEKGKALAKQL